MKKYTLFIVAIVLFVIDSIIDSNFAIDGVNLSQTLIYLSIVCLVCNAFYLLTNNKKS